jgi:hypothetical protein
MTQSLFTSRRLLAAGILTLGLSGAALVARPSEAAPPGTGCQTTGGVTRYYSDETLTRQVGEYTSTCQGVCTGRGRITPYFETFNFVCPPPPSGE